MAISIVLDQVTIKLQEAQSCYESGNYKSALLNYIVVSRVRRCKRRS